MEPGAGVGPATFGGGHRDPERGGGLVETEADVVAELDELGVVGRDGGEAAESFGDGEHALGGEGIEGQNGGFIEIDAAETATVTDRGARAGFFDENAAHGLGGGGEKVAAVVPRRLFRAAEAKPRLVDESGGLEGVRGGFAGELGGGEPTEFVVDERQQTRRSRGVAVAGLFQNESKLAHVAPRKNECRGACKNRAGAMAESGGLATDQRAIVSAMQPATAMTPPTSARRDGRSPSSQ